MNYLGPSFSSEKDLLCEMIVTEKEIRIVTELPHVSEENILIDVYPAKLVIIVAGEGDDYYEIFSLPHKTDTSVWKKSFSNGYLQITFKVKAE